MASGCCGRQTRGLKRANLTCFILFASTTVNLLKTTWMPICVCFVVALLSNSASGGLFSIEPF